MAAGEHNPRAFDGQPGRYSPPQPPARRRHQRYPPIEAEIHAHFLLTGFDNDSNPSILQDTTSPSWITTAPGVPVEIMSPGRDFPESQHHRRRSVGCKIPA
jgi:hypothetical protein